ncbi:MAG: TylF/MycF family methyltransferase [Bacteroidota bacterium]|nr:TylF/MycF family methyltransferase [Bacteroidota bacterium]
MNELQSLYLDLLKKTLIDFHRAGHTEYRPVKTGRKINLFIKPLLHRFASMEKRKLIICEKITYNQEDRLNGKDWPAHAESMIGYKRLSNIQDCVIDVLRNNIEGDLIETGVWRGGAVIFMRAILKAFDIQDRIVWAADSFQGLPRPDADKYPMDKEDTFYTFDELRVSLEQVKENFRKYGLLDEQVQFLQGWFKDTLPVAPIKKLAVLRLDGDMYESTMDTLTALYPKLSPGGYIIIDDWGSVMGCRKAVEDYRRENNINEKMETIDADGVFWQKH